MKDLCIDARMLHASGIGTYLKNLLPFFDKQYRLILLGNEKELSELNLKNAEFIEAKASVYSIKEQLQIPLRVPKSDLFWSPHYNAPVLPLKSKKRIVTIHDVYHLHYFDTLSPLQKIYVKIFLKSAVNKANEIITVSQFSKKELIKHVPAVEPKVNVIYNGVSNDFRLIENEESKEALKRKYSLPEKFILFVGNVKPHKNLHNLIKAFGGLKTNTEFRDYKLVIAGKSKGLITSAKNLDHLIDDLGIVSEILFLDHIEFKELPLLYNLAKLLVFPSFYEGFGLPPLEAMSCGCPTIVSDIDCLKEIYGDAPFYISPSDSETIKDGIVEVLKNETLKTRLIAHGMEHAKKFKWETAANQHLKVFEKALK